MTKKRARRVRGAIGLSYLEGSTNETRFRLRNQLNHTGRLHSSLGRVYHWFCEQLATKAPFPIAISNLTYPPNLYGDTTCKPIHLSNCALQHGSKARDIQNR